MSLKEQSFKSRYQIARERNAEEHKKLLAMANKLHQSVRFCKIGV